MNISEPNNLTDFIASNINITLQEKQELLEAVDVKDRMEKLTIFLNKELEILEIGSKIQSQVPAKMPGAAAEYTVARTYLEWLTSLPWNNSTEDNLDIRRARKILDEDHYDLDKVKERILEYLAVRKLKEDMKGPILCFVGPPGVGKTSLGQSIARAL